MPSMPGIFQSVTTTSAPRSSSAASAAAPLRARLALVAGAAERHGDDARPCAARRRRRGRAASCGDRRAARGRQADREARAAAGAVADVDRAAVRLDDLARDREPEPGAACARREERLEDARAQLGAARPDRESATAISTRVAGARAPRAHLAAGAATPRRRWRGGRAAPGTPGRDRRAAPASSAGASRRTRTPRRAELLARRAAPRGRRARVHRDRAAARAAAAARRRAATLMTLLRRSISAVMKAQARCASASSVGTGSRRAPAPPSGSTASGIAHLVGDRRGELPERRELLALRQARARGADRLDLRLDDRRCLPIAAPCLDHAAEEEAEERERRAEEARRRAR